MNAHASPSTDAPARPRTAAAIVALLEISTNVIAAMYGRLNTCDWSGQSLPT